MKRKQRSILAATGLAVLAGAAGASAGVDIYIIEQSGFFGVPGITPGVIGRLNTDDTTSVQIVASAQTDFNFAGMDFRPGETDRLYGFETTTNSLRRLPLAGGNDLIDSLGHVDNLVGGLTYSLDGQTVYAMGNASAWTRIVEADADSGAIIAVHNFVNVSCSALAIVPRCGDLPYPPGELWGVNNTTIGPRLVRFDLVNDTVIDEGGIVGLGFIQAFEVGLDWADDGTLYAAFQGVQEVQPNVFVDISARLYTIDIEPTFPQATLIGVIQAEDTWDIASIVVDNETVPSRADVTGDGCVGLDDLLLVLGQFGAANPEIDIDCDGTVDLDDLLILLGDFGRGCP